MRGETVNDPGPGNRGGPATATGPSAPPEGVEVRPLSGTLGVEVTGADVTATSSADWLRVLLLRHGVVAVRGQRLDPEGLVSFGERLGPLHIHPVFPHLEGFPPIVVVRNYGKAYTATEVWHSDVTFAERPPAFTALYALEVPPAGGDTLFADQQRAFELLSDGMRAMLRGLRAVHSGAGAAVLAGRDPAEVPEVVHPVVRVHPETGAETLFVNPAFTRRLDGFTAAESRPLLEWLFGHATRHDLTCRHRWAVGDLVLWDNRRVLHYAIHDHGDAPRTLHRITVEGDRPRGPADPTPAR